MRKRYLIAILTLSLLAATHSSIHAAPYTDADIRVWSNYWQDEYPWGENEEYLYAGVKTTDSRGNVTGKWMSKNGCLVTTLSMLLNYSGAWYMPDENYDPKINPLCLRPGYSWYCDFLGFFVINHPGTLNNWFAEKKIFIKKGAEDLLYWPTALKKFYVRFMGAGYLRWTVAVHPQDSCKPVSSGNNCAQILWSDPRAEQLLDYDLNQHNPAMMKIKWRDSNGGRHDSHFVLVAGYDEESESYRAYDPNQYYRLNDNGLPPGLSELYSSKKGRSYEVLRVDRVKDASIPSPGRPDQSSLTGYALSPVEIQIISPDGKTTGYDPATREKVASIPRAYYTEESESSIDADNQSNDPAKVLFLNEPGAGNYILRLYGTGDGLFTIKLQGVKSDGTVNLDTTLTGMATPSLSETYRITYSPTGEATLSQENQPPVADAGPAQTGEVSYEITLDGSGSHDPDGDPLKFTWSFVSKPNGSTATLSDLHSISPAFTPDLPGTYVLQLMVNDFIVYGSPDIVTITATPLKSGISVTPNLSQPLSAGSGIISFDVNNIGRVGVSSGRIDLTLNDPDGVVASTGSYAFSIGVGQAATVSVPVTIPSLKFGNYTLTYTQSDETKTGSPATATISNSVLTTFTFDKLTYRVRETANVTLNLTNTGKFNINDLSVTVSVPDARYTDTKTVSLAANANAAALNFAVPIPAAVTAGQHNVNVTLTLPSGSSTVQSSKFTVPESSLILTYSGPTTVSAGDMMSPTIKNTGGVDTTYRTEKLAITDGKGTVIYQGSIAGSVIAGEEKSLADIQVPPQAESGIVLLNVQAKDDKTGKISSLSKRLDISGLTATLQAWTDKDVYLATEPITGLSAISTGQIGIENGSLKLAVVKKGALGTGQFSHFLPKKGWWPFDSPPATAVAPDGSVYVIDLGSNSIQKFDGNGNFVVKWGSPGSDPGRFYYPLGIAVAPDGAVYVVDTGNHRVQKFDGIGNFVTSWGTWGYDNGQFSSPRAIAAAPDGSVYVADTGNHRIQKFDGSGNFITAWGSQGSGDGQFSGPEGITAIPDGAVYVADTNNHRIQKFDGNGNFLVKWGNQGSGDGQFNYPQGMAVGPDGSVYVADTWNHRIQKFDSNGNFISKWGGWGSANGQFACPRDITVAQDGSVYVADTNNDRIQKLDTNGNFLAQWGKKGADNGWFLYPANIAISPDGFLYIADTDNNRIQKFDSNGNFITKWGSPGRGDGQLSYPEGIAAGPDGSVYVVDTGNHRIQKFDSSGNFISKWGGWGFGDGQFYRPTDITVAPDNSVYVAEVYTHRIQKFDSNGSFILKWGGTYCLTDPDWDGIPDQECNGQFYGPDGVAVAPDGSVYVADSGNSRIQKFDSNGDFIMKWGAYCVTDSNWDGISDQPCDSQFRFPAGLAVDRNGSVYVADSDNNRVQKFDGSGNFLAKWGGYGSGDGQFDAPNGIAAAADSSVYAVDYYNHRIQRMAPRGDGVVTLYEATMPIVQPAGTTQGYMTGIGALNTTGKLYLLADLKNSLGQAIAASEYPFYIIDGNTVLLSSMDKKIYKPGEGVTINGEVRNLASIEATGLTLSVRRKVGGGTEEPVYTETFNVPAGGSHPFTFTTTAGAVGMVTLTGTVTQNNSTLAKIADQYEVASPQVTATVSMPEVAGNEAFGISIELKNEGKVDAGIQYAVDSSQGNRIDAQTISIPAGETRLLQYTQQIIGNTTYTFTFTGDLNQTITKTIAYGLAANITIDSEGQGQVYPEGRVSIPVAITNTGLLDETVVVTYQVRSQQSGASSQEKNYFIPQGASVTDTLYYDLTEGAYQLSATSQQPNATANISFSVLKENKVAMVTTAGTQGENRLIPVTMTLTNSGYNAINGSITLAVMNNPGKAVWRGEAEVTGLASGTSGSYIINVDSAGILPGAYSANVVLYSASGLQLAANQAQIRVLGPIFEITSLPNNPSFTVGRQGTLNFTVKNTGTLTGAASLKVAAMDILDQTVTDTLSEGEEKSYAFTFTVPEDAAEDDYLADYTLTPVNSQGTKGQAPFHVAQVEAEVTAALDKEAYRNGETAVLRLNISKQSQTEDGEYLAIIRYGVYHDMQTFTLSSQPVTLTFNIPLTMITGGRLFYGVHFQSGMAIQRDSIAINPAQPDLTVAFTGQRADDWVLTPEVGKDNAALITAAVTNYGKAPSIETTVAFYDGEELLETKRVRALNPQETQDITLLWNVLGKAGNRTLRAIVDPQDAVIEFSEQNNLIEDPARIPDITTFTDTDKDIYKIRQKVYISTLITNLTATTTYSGLMLTTTVKDPAGTAVYSKSSAVNAILPMASTTQSEIWNTAGLLVDGTYTITQTVTTGSEFKVQSSKSITLEKAPDFTLTTDVNSQKIKQGERATYTAAIEPILGWNHEVTMSMEGLPAGSTVSFSPDRLIPAGQSQTVVITTDATTAGAHTLYLTAQGTDEGEIVAHTIPLTLDVSGYRL